MTVHQLNDLLRRELGSAPIDMLHRNAKGELEDTSSIAGEPAPHGEGTFKWEWTEDLFWPSYPTGKKIMEAQKVMVPVIGSEEMQETEIQRLVPEYRRDRMTHRYRDQWIITAWVMTEGLAEWQSMFPGAPYVPAYRIHTNFVNDKGCLPTYEDTVAFIYSVKIQREKGFGDSMEASEEKAMAAIRSENGAMARECIPAFFHGSPGKRGNHVSFGGIVDSQGKEIVQ